MSADEPGVGRSAAGLAMVAVLLGTGAYMALSYARLPPTMASHFGFSGRADGWMDKGTFMLLYGIALVVAAVVLAAIALLVPRLPDSLINLPRKDYWLAPERRATTMARLGRWMLWHAAATVALLAWILHLSFRANLDGTGSLGGRWFWWAIGGYLGLTLGGWARELLRLRRVPREPPRQPRNGSGRAPLRANTCP